MSGRGGNDDLLGETGRDRLYGGVGADQLSGGTGKDRLYGGAGSDDVAGGGGADHLWGGADADRFVFDSTASIARDTIHDFVRGSDKIDLTDLSETGMTWIAGAAFDGTDGQLRAFFSRGGVLVQGDTNGDGRADFQLFVQNVTSLSALHFLLI